MSWKQVAIGEVAEIVSGATPKSTVAEYWGGNIAWATPTDLSKLQGKNLSSTERSITKKGLSTCAARVLPENSVLFSSRAPIGLVAINTTPMATNQGFKSFVPSDSLDSNFLYWWLKANRQRLDDIGTGATFKEVSKRVISEVLVPLPPVDEQRRIAAILDKADAIRRKVVESINLERDLVASEYIERFQRDSFDPIKIEELLETGYLLLHKDGNHGSNYPRKSEFGSAGVPFLTAKTISKSSRIDNNEVQYLSEAKARKLKIGRLKKNDVLLAHNATVGPVCMYDGRFEEALIGTSLTAFRCNPEKLLPEFLEEALRHPAFQYQLQAQMSQTTRNQVPITAQRRLSIVVPPIDEQLEFVSITQKILNASDKNASLLAESEQLFASLSQRAFRGEL